VNTQSQIWNRKTIAWYLYDFGRAFLSTNGIVYFSQWLILDQGIADFWLSLTFIISTLCVVLLSPYIGALTDEQKSYQMRLLWIFTIATFFSAILVQIVGVKTNPANAHITIAFSLILYGIFNALYLFAFFIYNTYLQGFTDSVSLGRVSGIGLAFQMIGSILGLVATLPIINGSLSIFGVGYIYVFVPSALLFLILSMPLLSISLKENRNMQKLSKSHRKLYEIYQNIWRDIRDSKSHPGIAKLLMILYFLGAAIFTLQLFSAIYLDRVIGATDSYKVAMLTTALAAVTVGAISGGFLADRYGRKRILLWSLLFAGLATAGISFAKSMATYPIFFGTFGLFVGMAFATVRALFAEIAPQKKNAEFFGLYSLSERSASVFGPILWSVVAWSVTSTNALNYRASVFSLAILLFIAAAITTRLDTRKIL